MKKHKKITLTLICSIMLTIAITVVIIYKLNTSNKAEISNSINEEEHIDSAVQNSNSDMTNSNNSTTKEQQEISNQGSEMMNNQKEDIKINIVINNKKFIAKLNNNETVKQLLEKLPLTLDMSELNSNEKYNYLNFNLPTNSSIQNEINAGDIKLYGNNCLVIFFKNFSNSYSYTDLGKVDHVSSFISELGNGNVTVKLELAN